MTCRLSHGAKTIDLAAPIVNSFFVDVGPPRTVQTTLTGISEVITLPRVDIRVRAEWPIMDSVSLLASLRNWAQAAQRGEAWTLALDSAKTVDTLLSLGAAAGDTTLYAVEPVGLTAGQTYKLIDGPNYQLVTIASVSGDLVTLTAALDSAFGAGAILRDQFYFRGVLREDRSLPIRLLGSDDGAVQWPPSRFIFAPEFQEDISTAQETSVMFKALSALAAGSDVATAQPWFPSLGGVAVAANTTYFFEGYLRISRAAGVVSHTLSLLFGGTATLTSIAYKADCNTGDVVTNLAENQTAIEVATATVVKAASTSATEQIAIKVSGVVRINVAGTFIPQFQYSAAPGGAPSILANSWFQLTPVGPGSVVSSGTWS